MSCIHFFGGCLRAGIYAHRHLHDFYPVFVVVISDFCDVFFSEVNSSKRFPISVFLSLKFAASAQKLEFEFACLFLRWDSGRKKFQPR